MFFRTTRSTPSDTESALQHVYSDDLDVEQMGWEVLLNRGGTTFRKLPDAQKTGLNDRKAISLMLAQPSMIKRPVLEMGKRLLVGFQPSTYAKVVGKLSE